MYLIIEYINSSITLLLPVFTSAITLIPISSCFISPSTLISNISKFFGFILISYISPSFSYSMASFEDFKIKVKKFLVFFLIAFVKFVEICLILMFVYSLNFLDFLCISFEVDAIDKRFKVSAPAILTT